MHILSPLILLESAEGETKVSVGQGIEPRTSGSKSDTELDGLCYVSIFAKCFILRANRELRTEFRTMLTFTSYGPLKRNADLALLSSIPTGVGIRQSANGAPRRAEFNYRFNNMHILSDIS